MKILVIGAGGTGGLIGGFLAKEGNDVTFIARGRHLAAMQEKGLTLETKLYGTFTINPCHAMTMEEYNDTPDAIFVCVKYYSLQETISFIGRVAGPETIVLPILNVFGTGGVINEALPDCTVLDGCMYVVGQIKEPGTVLLSLKFIRVIAGYRPGQPHTLEPKLRALLGLMNEAHIKAEYSDNILRDALQKFAFVSPMGAACIYFNAHSEDFQQPGEVRDTFCGLVKEVIALGQAMGITFEKDLVAVGLKMIDGYSAGIGTSMSRDVDAGNPSEFAGLVTRIVELGKKYQVPVPLYEKINDWGRKKGL